MKALKSISFCSAIVGLLFLYSCNCNEGPFGTGDYYSFQDNNQLSFNILDKDTKENVLLIGHTKYNYDTARVYDEHWQKTSPEDQVRFDGLIILWFIDKVKDKDVLDQLISRRFYFYFNHEDTDTIDIDFKMRKDNCKNQVMSYFKIAYNDSIYFDGPTDYVPGQNFLK